MSAVTEAVAAVISVVLVVAIIIIIFVVLFVIIRWDIYNKPIIKLYDNWKFFLEKEETQVHLLYTIWKRDQK